MRGGGPQSACRGDYRNSGPTFRQSDYPMMENLASQRIFNLDENGKTRAAESFASYLELFYCVTAINQIRIQLINFYAVELHA